MATSSNDSIIYFLLLCLHWGLALATVSGWGWISVLWCIYLTWADQKDVGAIRWLSAVMFGPVYGIIVGPFFLMMLQSRQNDREQLEAARKDRLP